MPAQSTYSSASENKAKYTNIRRREVFTTDGLRYMVQLPVKIAAAKQDDFNRRLGTEISNLTANSLL